MVPLLVPVVSRRLPQARLAVSWSTTNALADELRDRRGRGVPRLPLEHRRRHHGHAIQVMTIATAAAMLSSPPITSLDERRSRRPPDSMR